MISNVLIALFFVFFRFFEHLKKHYEPPSNKDPSTVPSKKEKKSPTPEPAQKLKQEPGKSGWTAEADASSSPVVDSETVVQPAADVAKGNQQQESLLSSLLCLTCIECNKTFRRQKTFEQHMRDVHTPKEESQNDEFSEPEDFMVGINVVVNDNDPTSDYDNGDVDEDSKAWYKEEDLHQAEEDLKEMEESNGHVCHLCNQPFPLRAILLQHLVTCRVINADAEPVNPAPSPKKKTNKKKGCYHGARRPNKKKWNRKEIILISGTLKDSWKILEHLPYYLLYSFYCIS